MSSRRPLVLKTLLRSPTNSENQSSKIRNVKCALRGRHSDDIFRDPELESIHTLGWPKGSFRIPQMNLLANPKY